MVNAAQENEKGLHSSMKANDCACKNIHCIKLQENFDELQQKYAHLRDKYTRSLKFCESQQSTLTDTLWELVVPYHPDCQNIPNLETEEFVEKGRMLIYGKMLFLVVSCQKFYM